MRNSYCILGIFLLSLLMSIPLLHGKITKGHDIEYAFTGTVSLSQSWTYGDPLGRWTPDILQGYGYPSLNYYPPLFTYITTSLATVLHNLIWGFNLGLLLVLFASGCAMFLYAREFWGKEGAFLSAVAYLFAPYHIVDLYVRGACAEFTSFIFVPLVLYAFHRLTNAPKTSHFLFAAFSLTGLALSHNIMAMFCFPLSFVYAMILVAQKKSKVRWAMLYMLTFAAAIGLSLFFCGPALLERGYIQIERLAKTYDYHHHFLYWDQLFYSPWGNGGSGTRRGGNLPSFQIGPVHLLLATVFLLRYRQWNPFIVFWSIAALAASIMTVGISAPVWEIFPFLSITAFPWRFLLVVTVGVSFLAGGACTVFKRSRIMLCLSGAALVIAANIFYCHDFGYLDISVKDPKAFLYASYPMENMVFLPKYIKAIRLVPSEEKLEVIQGEGKVIDHHSPSGLHHAYTFLASTPTLLFFHAFYFPGWEVAIDKRPAPILSDNPFGLIAFAVPQGERLIEIDFRTTPVRTMAERASLTVLLLLMLLFLFRKKIDPFLRSKLA